MNVLTINYNTQELTDAMILSVNKHTTGCRIYVFDNSDREPFRNSHANVEVIDNTRCQIINWEKWLRKFPNKYPRVGNDYGSAKHCYSVDLCFDLIPDGFVLVDSDILVKQDISCLYDEEFVASGMIVSDQHYISIPRLAPYLCYINVPMCREHGIGYFDAAHMWKLTCDNPNRFYDTGAWFLQSVEKRSLPIKRVNISEYMTHLRNGSWRNNDYKLWLNEHKDLWTS